VSRGAGGGAPRAAAALAALALAHGAAPRERAPAPCPQPRLAAAPADALPQVVCADAADVSGVAPAGVAGVLFGLRIDPNEAGPRTLDALPGIGPARAAAIVREARRRPFCTLEELERVPGIGPATRAKLAGWVAPRAGACAR
jgi:competence protein ComEA